MVTFSLSKYFPPLPSPLFFSSTKISFLSPNIFLPFFSITKNIILKYSIVRLSFVNLRWAQLHDSLVYCFVLFHMTRHKHNLITLLHLQSLKSSFRLNSLGKFFCGFHFYPYFWPVGQVWMYHDKWWIWKFPPSDRIFYSPPPQAIWT